MVTEKLLKRIIEEEHSVVLDRIREDTRRDEILLKLSKVITEGNWQTWNRDANLAPFYPN